MTGTDLSSVWFLAIAAGVAIVGLIGLWLVRRRPRSMQTSMDAFSRELRALAPNAERRRQSAVPDEQVIDLRDPPVERRSVQRRQPAGVPRSATARRRRPTGQG